MIRKIKLRIQLTDAAKIVAAARAQDNELDFVPEWPFRRCRWTALALCGLMAGCDDHRTTPVASATPREVASSSARSPVALTSSFDFPVVPGWERETPRALGYEPGFSLGYNLWSPEGPIAVTIFVYKRGLSHIPAGASSKLVIEELNESLAGIQELVRRREKYRSADVRARDKITLGTGPDASEAQRIVLNVSYFDGPPTVSSILMTAAKEHFVKIRITQPGTAADAEDRALRPLLEAIGRALL